MLGSLNVYLVLPDYNIKNLNGQTQEHYFDS